MAERIVNYIELTLCFPEQLTEETAGIHIAQLGDMGFESFVEQEHELLCYIPCSLFPANKEQILHYIDQQKSAGVSGLFSEIEQQNWNALWESNFEPTFLNDCCTVRAPFHEKTNAEIEIIIMPKMSFGTGHHETTRLMMEDIFELDIAGKTGLDMGCGTGVLAILAAKRGALRLDAIDIDSWAWENSTENIATNQTADRISAKLGDVSLIDGLCYDFILANINRNILLEDMRHYVTALAPGGTLSISGFLEQDLNDLRQCAQSLGLTHQKTASHQKWQMMRFVK